MLPVADVGVVTRPPVLRVRSDVIGELAAVRAVVTRVSPRVAYVVRFRVGGRADASSGCVASATVRVHAGSATSLRVALRPRRAWCPGASVLSVVSVRQGAPTGAVRLRVRPAEALGRGDLVGRLLLGPTCPVERVNDPCDPVARPAPVTVIAIDASGNEAARAVTLGDGSFALDLSDGSYLLHVESTGAGLPRFSDQSVVVTARATRAQPQRVVVTGDTGIR